MTHPFLPQKEIFTARELEQQETEFRQIFERIMNKAEEKNIVMRLSGSMAFRIKTQEYNYISFNNNRYLADLDFIIYNRDIIKVQDMFFEMGWTENQNVLRLFGDKRRIFYHPSQEEMHCDIFIDKLRFCHTIDLRNRLEIEYPTISLIDMLLQKLQIIEINQKDLVDLILLMRKFPFSDQQKQNQINISYLAKLCAKSWGWWKTVNLNLKKLEHFCDDLLSDKKDIYIVSEKITKLKNRIEAQPKSTGWKLRSVFGDKLKWYDQVEEVDRG